MKVLHVHDKEHRFVERGAVEGVDGLWLRGGGGLAVYIAHVVRELRTRDWQVAVVGLAKELQQPVEGGHGSYRLKAFRYRFRRSVAAALDRILAQEAPDIIHLHSIPTLHPLLLGRMLRTCPVVWTFHDVTPVCFRRTKLLPDGRLCHNPLGLGCVTGGCFRPGDTDGLLKDTVRVLSHPLYLRMYRRASLLLVPSVYLHDVLVANGFEDERVRVTPLFSRFAGLEPAHRTGADPARILFVGRLSAEKGILPLLEALALLATESWEAWIVGDGPLKETARELATRLGIANRTAFLSESDDGLLTRQYRSCSFVVVPSLVPESFGMVGVEAMSHGKAVVAFRSGGITEWLHDGDNGCLVEHGDVSGLADAVRRLIRDPEMCQRMGEAGRRRYRAGFTLERHVNQVVSLYREVIRNDRGTRK